MTNEDLESLIRAYDTRAFPSFYSLRALSDTVVLGHVWRRFPLGDSTSESSDKIYFVLANGKCVAGVLDMDYGNVIMPEDLHWLVLPEYRGKGYLHFALRDVILPHLFAGDRESLTVTVEELPAISYAVRQGFEHIGKQRYRLTREKVDLTKIPKGTNTPLTDKERKDLKARLRVAKALIFSVHESLMAHFDRDALWLHETADGIESEADNLSDLKDDGTLPR